MHEKSAPVVEAAPLWGFGHGAWTGELLSQETQYVCSGAFPLERGRAWDLASKEKKWNSPDAELSLFLTVEYFPGEVRSVLG